MNGRNTDRKTTALIALLLAAIITLAGCQSPYTKKSEVYDATASSLEEPSSTPADRAQATSTTASGEPMTKNHYAVFDTSLGTFKAELFEDKASMTTKNFITLAEKGFYNGVVFHRVIPGFMIQGGDPTGTGMGGPGYTIKDEFGPGLKHDSKGMLSMANAGPNTGGSQFFVTIAPTPWLDGRHAIFGKVVEGYDIAEKISLVARDGSDRPRTPVVMKKVTITDP